MPKTVRFLPGLALLCGGASFGQAPSDGFPPGEGRDTFVRVCSTCHDLNVMVGKRLDRPGWDEMVHVMIDRGAVASDVESKAIVDYLHKNYPEK